MKLTRLATDPDWKLFLGLGEELLRQSTAQAQCDLIATTLQSQMGCDAQVWLAEPYYPLPGDSELLTLPGAPVPDLVRQAFTTRQPACLAEDASSAKQSPRSLAFPIQSQNQILGIIFAQRNKGRPFSKKEWNFFEGLAAHAGVALQAKRQTVLTNWRHEQLALVRSVSAQVANVTDLDQLCQRVTRLILETYHYYHVAIFTLEPGLDELLFRAYVTQGIDSDQPLTYSVRMGEGMIGTAAQTGEEQIAANVETHPHFRFLEGLEKTRSEACFPIMIDKRILGVLDLESDRKDAFNDDDIMVLRGLANSIALAIEGARLYTNLKRRADQDSAVFEVTHVLTSILDLDQLLEEVVQIIHKRFGYQYVHIFSVHPGRRKIFYLTGSGSRSERMRLLDFAYELDESNGVIINAARTGKSYLANDVIHDPIYRASALAPDDTRSELAIPLSFGNEILGVLDLQSDREGAFSAEDVSLLESVADSIAIAYHNASMYRSEQWRRQVADSFRDVAGLLSSNIALGRLLDTILTELKRNLPCDASAVWLVDENVGNQNGSGRSLHLAAVHGVTEAEINQARESSDLVRTWLSDSLNQTDPTIRRPEDPYGPLGTSLGLPSDYSSIAAPLRTGDEVLGVLTLAHHTANRYGTEARTIITTFASYAAVAIHNARLFNEAQTQAWLSTILLQVAEASQTVNSIDELLSSMVRLTRLLVGVKKCAMFLYDETQEAFVLKAWYGLDRKPQHTIFFESEVPALARLHAKRTTLFIQDPALDLNLPSAALNGDNGTIAVLPLQARDSLLGAFLVAYQSPNASGSHPNGLDPQIQSILQGIAHQTSTALENLSLLDGRQEEAYVTAVLLQVAQAVVSQNDLQDILDTIVHLMPILIGIDASVFCLWDPIQQHFYTAQVYASSRSLETDLLSRTYQLNEFRLLGQVYQGDAPYYCKLPVNLPAPSGWYDLPVMPIEYMKADTLAEGEDWLLGFPLSVKGELLGVLVAKETETSTSFQERRLEIVTGIAQQAALAIQNERLKQQMVMRERMEREMQLAREIQTTFLPNRLPVCEGWQIGARWQTARQVGGDFYDIFYQGRDRLCMAIADVSDKGMPAALYMTVARTLIRAFSQGSRSSACVLEKVNNPLVTDTPHSMFVTAVYAKLWPETGQLEYANAGHNRPLLLSAKNHRIEVLPKGGMAMGVMKRNPIQDHTLVLEPGDCLIFYTDGVTECFSPENEAYGEERLTHTLEACIGMDVEEVLSTIVDSLAEFRSTAAASDDMTLLAIRRL